MKQTRRFSIRCMTIFSAILILAGCAAATSPVTFYTLTPLPGIAMESPGQTDMQSLAVGIGPARFPDILNRPQIVTRSGPNRLTVSEFHRWGGSLDQDFLRVLAVNISSLLATNRIVAFPWEDLLNPTYQIAFDVQQFDGRPGDVVRLNVTWTIKKKDIGQALYIRRSDIQQPVSEKSYDALVAAHSQALEALSREIAAAIKTILK